MKRKVLLILCLTLSMLLCSCTLMPAFAFDIVHESLYMPEGYTKYIAVRHDKQEWLIYFNEAEIISNMSDENYLRLKFSKNVAYRFYGKEAMLKFLEGKSDTYASMTENKSISSIPLGLDYAPENGYVYATNAILCDPEGKILLTPSWYVEGTRQTYENAYGFSSDQLYKHTIAETLGVLSPVMAVLVVYIAIRKALAFLQDNLRSV